MQDMPAMKLPPKTANQSERRTRGFERTSGLVQGQIRKASEKRGFAETRLLTHWVEIGRARDSTPGTTGWLDILTKCVMWLPDVARPLINFKRYFPRSPP